MQDTKGALKILYIITSLIVISVASYFIFPVLEKKWKSKSELVNSDRSIAVLPFVNISSDSGREYFSDGLTDGIINSLAHMKGLKVCARTSSSTFKGKNVNIKEVGEKLGVHTVLEGSLHLEKGRIRIIAQLINADDGFHFWSEQYDENMDDVFALQDKIARDIAKKLEITLLETDRHKVSGKTIINKAAYELYLKGRSSWNLRTPTELKKGIEFFEQAVALEPLFAAAYSGMADCYTALGYGSFLSPKESFPKAFEAATKALALDSTLAEPHASLAFYKFYYDWDWATTEQEFRIAIALNPNYEIAYDWYGYYLTAMKRYEEAVVILKKARELDPLSVPISTDMGFSLYYSGNYDLAIKELQAALQVNPKFVLANIWLGRNYQAKKMYPEAIASYRKALEISVNWPVALAAIGNVYGVSGQKVEAHKILDTLRSLETANFVTSYGVALVYAGLNENEEAFQWLNKAFEERSNWLVWFKTDIRWASLRSDNRYTELVNRLGLPY